MLFTYNVSTEYEIQSAYIGHSNFRDFIVYSCDSSTICYGSDWLANGQNKYLLLLVPKLIPCYIFIYYFWTQKNKNT